MSFDLRELQTAVAGHGAVVRLLVTRVAGSVPRGAGTSMLVWSDGQSGTIGGGELEFRAIAKSREMLATGRSRMHQTLPLGPALGQCCGGSVTLVWEAFDASTLPRDFPYVRPLNGQTEIPAGVARKARRIAPGSPPLTIDGWLIEAETTARQPLWIYGAGHVGRALVDVLHPLPDYAMTWVDTTANRFPDAIPDTVTPVVATDPALMVRHAPANAAHLILTYSHDLDLRLCHVLLNHRFASVGLIGSASKWARFRSRLTALGHAPDQIARITCPIGDPALGKHPQAIAIGVASRLLQAGQSAIRKDKSA